MIGFILGSVFGAAIVFVIMCCVQISKEDYEINYHVLLLKYTDLNARFEIARKENMKLLEDVTKYKKMLETFK